MPEGRVAWVGDIFLIGYGVVTLVLVEGRDELIPLLVCGYGVGNWWYMYEGAGRELIRGRFAHGGGYQ